MPSNDGIRFFSAAAATTAAHFVVNSVDDDAYDPRVAFTLYLVISMCVVANAMRQGSNQGYFPLLIGFAGSGLTYHLALSLTRSPLLSVLNVALMSPVVAGYPRQRAEPPPSPDSNTDSGATSPSPTQ